MSRKTFLLAALAYLLPTFPLGYVWHLVTFADHYGRLEIYRADVIIPLGLASMLVQALLFAWAYPRIADTSQHWMRGAVRFGAFFGLVAWSFAVLPVAAKYRMASIADFLLLETAFTVVQFSIVAPLIALAYRGPGRRAGDPALA